METNKILKNNIDANNLSFTKNLTFLLLLFSIRYNLINFILS